ncbi:MAG: VTT domain-containing protein [Patescibacteria group bacterium]
MRAFWVVTAIIFSSLVFLIIVFTDNYWRQLLFSQTLLRDKILSYGPWASLVIITYEIIQVVLAPLPGQAVDMANGYIFGIIRGSFNSFIGITIGSIIAILLARKYGQPLVFKILSQEKVDRIYKKIGHRTFWFFVLLFLIPGLPDDVLCFILGLTYIPLWQGVLAAILGRAPNILVAVIFGATGQSLSPWIFIFMAAGTSSLLYALFRYLPKFKKYRELGR